CDSPAAQPHRARAGHGEHANLWGLFLMGYVWGSRDEGELMPKMVWRVKLVAELEPGSTTEVEVARLERDEQAGLADLGLRLAEAKQLTAALQAEMVPAQVTVVGERRRSCEACGGVLASKGHYTATFRSLFGKVADLLSDLLPISGAQNAGTVRNRTLRVGEAVAQTHLAKTAKPTTTQPAEPVVVGLDGGYVRSRHRQEERHFEVVAGKAIDADGIQSRFAFARNG